MTTAASNEGEFTPRNLELARAVIAPQVDEFWAEATRTVALRHRPNYALSALDEYIDQFSDTNPERCHALREAGRGLIREMAGGGEAEDR